MGALRVVGSNLTLNNISCDSQTAVLSLGILCLNIISVCKYIHCIYKYIFLLSEFSFIKNKFKVDYLLDIIRTRLNPRGFKTRNGSTLLFTLVLQREAT